MAHYNTLSNQYTGGDISANHNIIFFLVLKMPMCVLFKIETVLQSTCFTENHSNLNVKNFKYNKVYLKTKVKIAMLCNINWVINYCKCQATIWKTIINSVY